MANGPSTKQKWIVFGVLLFIALMSYVGITYKITQYGP